MATSNVDFVTSMLAAEDLDTHQYLAFALNDGKVANNAGEAVGIIQNKPKNGEAVTVAYFGELKFKAGGAIAKDADITVATSGYFTQADSNDTVAGFAKAAVTSGSNGTGFFNFATPVTKPSALTYTVTAADAITAGKGYTLADNKLANNTLEVNGIAPAAIASGAAGEIVVFGVVTATLADSYGPGQTVMTTTSGYLTAVASGYGGNARVLVGAASGTNGTVMFWGGGIGAFA